MAVRPRNPFAQATMAVSVTVEHRSIHNERSILQCTATSHRDTFVMAGQLRSARVSSEAQRGSSDSKSASLANGKDRERSVSLLSPVVVSPMAISAMEDSSVGSAAD